MSPATIWILVDICQRMLTIPLSLFSALMFSEVFDSSFASRSLTLAVIAVETAYVFRPHEITNIIVLYLTGFGAMLFFIWSAIMLLFCRPLQDFRRLRRVKIKQNDSQATVKYEWEDFPAKIGWKRMAWVFDLLFNLRGIGWNFRRPCYPVPDDIRKLYKDIGINLSSKNTIRSNTLSASAFRQEVSVRLITRYLLVDLCINFMDVSPFFQASRPPLEWIFPLSIQNAFLFPYNTLLAAIGVYAVLDLYATCVVIVLVSLLGPEILGAWGEPFMYPRLWGSLYAIWNGGLVGFWSIMWHDLFKYAFQTFARGLIPEPFNSDIQTHAYKIRTFLRLQAIFLVSGICHAAASYIQAAHTYPILTFIAFTSQGLGISIQQIIATFLGKTKTSEIQRKSATFIFGIVWTYFTMYMFLSDLAASKAFQLKLVPFSVGGLILGRRGPGWIGS